MLRSLSTALLAGTLALAGGTRLAAQSADLAIGVTDAPDPVNFGANVTYTLSVSNLGPNAATGVMVTNTIPAGFNFVSANINLGSTVVTQRASVVTYTNTVWRYNQAGTDLGTAWTAAGYNDAAWPSGRGALAWEPNYASGTWPIPINTSLTMSNGTVGIITHYFRTTFNYTNATTNTTMTLRYMVDDGLVIHLNGQEIHRDTNMPTGTITYTNRTRGNHDENKLVTNVVTVNNLVAGTNTLAVEVHQVNATSSDVFFALAVDIESVSGGVGAGYTVVGSNVVFTIGSMPASSAATLTVVGRADAYGAATNTVRVIGSTTDPNAANNTAQTVTSVNPPSPADISLAVVDNPDPIQVGNPLTYTIFVTNVGPSYATNVMVTNVLPAGVSFVSATFSNVGQVTQTLSFVTMTNVWRYNQLGIDLGPNWVEPGYDDSTWPAGAGLLAVEDNAAIVPYINTPLAIADAGGTHIITYYFRTTFEYQGPTLAVTSLLSALVDDGAVFYLNGKEIWRTTNMGAGAITYTNLALAQLTENVVITTNLVLTNLVAGTNVLAVEVHQINATSSDIVCGMALQQTQIGRGLYEVKGNQVVFRLGNLPNGIVSRIDMVVTPGNAGTLFNTFAGGSTVFDNNLANNSAITSTLVSTEPVGADVTVSITDTPDPVVQGQDLTYNVAVRNLGPALAVNTRLTNYLSPSVTLVSASPGCALVGSVVICNLGTLAVSGQSNISVVVRPSSVGVVTNLVTAASDTVDLAITNNAALASSIVLTSLRADLQVAVVSRPAAAIAGELFTNIVTVYNAGPSNAPSVVLTNQLSGAFVLNDVRINGAGTVFNLGGGLVACSLGGLAVGGSVSVEFVVQAVSVGIITDAASARSTIFDPDANNSSVIATTRVNPAPVVDLAVGVAANPATIYAGEEVTYTVAVTNNGALTGTGIQMTNVLPAGMTLIGLTNSQGACTNLNGMVVCNFGTLAGGAVVTVSYKMVAPGAGTLTNAAVALLSQPDFNLVDNVAIHIAVVIPNTAADLDLSVVPTATNLHAGEELTYRLTLVNKGPLDATGVTITNVLPVLVTYLRANTTLGSILAGSNGVVVAVGSLPRGSTMQAVIVGRVDQAGSLTNLAVAAGQQPDPTPNVVRTVVNASPAADVTVSILGPPGAVAATDPMVYTVIAKNNGPSSASRVLAYCYLPPGAAFQGAFATAGTYSNTNGMILWNLGTMVMGATARLEIDVVPGDIGYALANVGIVADEYDPDPANNALAANLVLSALGGTGIVVTATTNANALAAAITASGATGVKVNSVDLQAHQRGETMSSGLYAIGSVNAYKLTLPGVVLSTGNVGAYGTGANQSTNTTTAYNVPATVEQEALLDPITHVGTNYYDHFDVTQLDIYFDMLPGYNEVSFDVVFGSEEFPEWVNKSYIDGFGIFLDGQNIAFAAGAPVNINHPNMAVLPETELDGVIVLPGNQPVMKFKAPVVPGSTGHKLTFIVADTSDARYDTTVYIASLEGVQGAVTELAMTAQASPQPVPVGAPLTYTIAVTNAGPSVATNTVLQAILPALLTNVSVTVSTGTFGITNGVLTCQLGNLARHGAAVVTIRGRPAYDARFQTDFYLTSSVSDLEPANNRTSIISAAVEVGSFYNPAEVVIRDGAVASPYPSAIQVSGLTGVVDKVVVTLLDLTHSYPADIQALLVAPDGRNTILMAEAGGGFGVVQITVRFDDAAANYLPTNQAIASGSYKPTNLGRNNFFPGLPGNLLPPLFGSGLQALRRSTPNGAWQLYLYDEQGTDSGRLVGGWNLKLTTVPEMTVRVVGSNVVVSWHDLPGYVLEGATQISGTIAWTAVPGTPVVAGGMRTMTVPMATGYKYFRLRK